MALPAELRFPDRRRIRRVIETGVRIATPLGRIVAAPAPDGQGRILFAVSKAVSKKSSERNRIKRRLDEWARLNRVPGLDRWDIVAFVSPNSVLLPAKSLRLLAQEMATRVCKRPLRS